MALTIMPQVATWSSKHFEASSAPSLLEAELCANGYLGNSFRTCRCNSCLTRLLTGTTRALQGETRLSNVEREQGWALTCVRTRQKPQKTILEVMWRVFELTKMGEVKERSPLQQMDRARPANYRPKPPRLMIVLGSTLAALLGSMPWVPVRGYKCAHRVHDQEQTQTSGELRRAWRFSR